MKRNKPWILQVTWTKHWKTWPLAGDHLGATQQVILGIQVWCTEALAWCNDALQVWFFWGHKGERLRDAEILKSIQLEILSWHAEKPKVNPSEVNLLVKQHALSCAIKVCMTVHHAYVLFSNRSACYEASNIFGVHSVDMAGTTVPLSRFLSAVLRATWTSC